MKPITQALLALIAATPVFAGVSEPTPAPAPTTYSSEMYHWFIGGGGDYLFDSEEDYWNAHFGYNFNDASALFVEVGWVGREDDFGGGTADIDMVPITLNYKYEYEFAENWSWYIGAGLGAGNVDVELPGGVSDDDWNFVAQAFTGIVYEITPSFEIYAGFRYLWIDDTTILDEDVDNLDDWGIGAGLRFNF